MIQNIQYRLAAESQVAEIMDLLNNNSLPINDILENKIEFIVATSGDNKIVGCIGLERYVYDGLLRSFAVDKEYRNQKIGNALYNRLLSFSEQSGITILHLLTTSAEKYFSQKGFIVVKREKAPNSIRKTTEFSSLCPSSSTYMLLDLERTALSYYNDLQAIQVDKKTGSSFWSIKGMNVQFTSFEVPANTVFENHEHSSEQITYVLEGELFFETEGTIHCLAQGDSIVIPEGKTHKVWTGSIPAKAVDAWSPVNKNYDNPNP